MGLTDHFGHIMHNAAENWYKTSLCMTGLIDRFGHIIHNIECNDGSPKPRPQSDTVESAAARRACVRCLQNLSNLRLIPASRAYTSRRDVLLNKQFLITGADSGIGHSAVPMMACEREEVTMVYLLQEQSEAQEVKSQNERESKEK
ncbi:hypothetical protein CROQUDRAFT_91192 [Cronartium quercuum f. sp. fusiforme G11]|uniref:Uncharacterized protein n=1 Tax=Cronartium quercuum f. sp. fusiforme G11 TaxID=708437 RepID=A0A9P6NLC2_9BASI|nr:hypothetical protein CROQUDRAFT_91192 [Cronartium quercuum f. sp. fusiforme G11]